VKLLEGHLCLAAISHKVAPYAVASLRRSNFALYMFIHLTNEDLSEIISSSVVIFVKNNGACFGATWCERGRWYVRLNTANAGVSDLGLALQTVAVNLLTYSV